MAVLKALGWRYLAWCNRKAFEASEAVFHEGRERGYLAAIDRAFKADLERNLFRKQLEWSASHPHVRGERHAEGANDALDAVLGS